MGFDFMDIENSYKEVQMDEKLSDQDRMRFYLLMSKFKELFKFDKGCSTQTSIVSVLVVQLVDKNNDGFHKRNGKSFIKNLMIC